MSLDILVSCGADCLDVEKANTCAEEIRRHGDPLEISFAGVRSLSPSFANVIALAIEERKRDHPDWTIRVTHLNARLSEILKRSIEAARSSSAGDRRAG